MATQKKVDWHKAKIEIGDGETPEVFAAPCAIITRGLELSAENSQVFLLDCATPGVAGWATRNVVGKSASISGNGSLDPGDYATWRDFYMDAVPKNVRFNMDIPVADGGGYWEGPFILTTFNNNAGRDDNGGVMQFEIELMSAGDLTWTDAAA